MRLAFWLALIVLAACRPFGDSMTRQLDRTGVLDLTYALDAKTPHWPGEAYRPFDLRTIATLEKDGVLSKAYCTPEHLGTHMDAPNHFERGQPSVADVPLRSLYGPVFVLDISARAARDPDAWLTLEDVRAFERRLGRRIPRRALVFLRTGWGKRVRDLAAYKNQDAQGRLHFPGYSPEAAEVLVRERGVSALGIDTLSIDRGLSTKFEVHHIVNGAGRYGLENLANLDLLPEAGAFALVAPVKIAEGSGGQARVLAFVPR
jgi:kynurenine formamidase